MEEMASFNCWWRNLNHFAKCSKFEQPLHQIVTRREKWSTSAGSGWPRGFSLVVQVSGGALTRTSSVARQSKSNPIFGEIGSTQFLEQGFAPCSFFRDAFRNRFPAKSPPRIHRERLNGQSCFRSPFSRSLRTAFPSASTAARC